MASLTFLLVAMTNLPRHMCHIAVGYRICCYECLGTQDALFACDMMTRTNSISLFTICLGLAISMVADVASADFSGNVAISSGTSDDLIPGTALELTLGNEWDNAHRLAAIVHGAFFVHNNKGAGGGGAAQFAYRYRTALYDSTDAYFELSSGFGMLVGKVACAIDVCAGFGLFTTAEVGLRIPTAKKLAWTVALAADSWLLVPGDNVHTVRLGVGLDF